LLDEGLLGLRAMDKTNTSSRRTYSGFALLVALPLLWSMSGCGPSVALSSDRYMPQFDPAPLASYHGKVLVLRGFENVDEKTNFYSYPGKGRYYGGPVLTSYFWYCFKSAFTKLGVNVFEEGQGPSGAPTMDVKLVRIAEDGFTANVTVAVSSGRPPLMKSYTIAGPTITDFQKSALESRAYQMMTALFWSVASDPQFQAIVAP
jgi:hypothetical protein